MKIYLGDKNLSSWSLRAWLALAHTGAPFEEVMIPLDRPDTAARIKAVSPSGRVPALADGDVLVWDSLAIGEYLAERFPAAKLWPDDPAARAAARAMCAEMHAGFAALRTNMPMDLRAASPGEGRAPGVAEDVARILELWRTARARFGAGGPFLFGRFSLADCFFAPVVTRFRTYAVEVDEAGRAYLEAVEAWPAMRAWRAAAEAETSG